MARLFVALQYLLPQHWMTAMMWRVARIRHVGTKNFLIERFIKLFELELDDVKLAVPDEFATFNDFFIRELKASARRIDVDDSTIVSPVDGTLSIAGTIRSDSLLQAKGIEYTLQDLLATDLHIAREFVDGSFATAYLAPYNYHRVHAPMAGELLAAHYVPGDLFSVNNSTATHVSGLLRRNERLIMQFQTTRGLMILIFVGALMVGSIATPWSGEIRPRKTGVVEVLDISRHPTTVDKGDLLGWFNMGSTVIMLLPRNCVLWDDDKQAGSTLKMGERIGKLRDKKK